MVNKKEKTLVEVGDNINNYILNNNPKEVFIDVSGYGYGLYDYVQQAFENRVSQPTLIKIHGIGKSDDMAFVRYK